MRKRTLLSILAVAALAFAAPLAAQGKSTVTAIELDAAVSARPAGTGQTVNGAAAQDQSVARRGGQAQDGERVLAGGDVVITTTVLIIALLVIIIIIVA